MPSIAPHPLPRLFATTPEGDDVPDFHLWRAKRMRANGWTTHDQRLFIHELCRCGSVAAAVKAVGKTARSAYLLREKLGAESFSAAWNKALHIGIEKVRRRLCSRYTDGELVPRFYHGKVIGTIRKYNDRALVAVLESLMRCPPLNLARQKFIAIRNEEWDGVETTLSDYRNRLFAWENALRHRERILEWNKEAKDEADEIWRNEEWTREWERQARAEEKAEIAAKVKATREQSKQHHRPGPKVRVLW